MRNTLLLAFMLSSLITKAQSEFVNCKIVPLKGDTIYGLVKYSQWRVNPEIFEFKRNSNSNIEKLGLNEIDILIIEGKENYQKSIVTKYTNQIDINSLPTSFSEESKQDTVFLKQLIQGNKFNLYFLNDGSKNHFFIQKPGGVPQALRYVMYKNDGLLVEVKTYIQQLREFVDSDSKVLNQLNKLRYNYDNIIAISEKLNTTAILSQDAYDDIKTHKFSRLYISGGMLTTSFSKYEIVRTNFSRINFPVNISPIFEFGAEFVSKYMQQRFFGRAFLNLQHLGYSGSSNYSEGGSNYKGEYKLSAITSQIGIGLNLIVIKKPVGLSVGGGSAFNINYWYKNEGVIKNVTTNNSAPIDKFDIRSTSATFFVCTELHLKNTNSIFFSHRLNGDQTFDPTLVLNQSGWSIMFTFRFLKNRKLTKR